MHNPIKNLVVCGLVFVFLAGAAVDRHMSMAPPEDAGPYLTRVKEATAHLPLRIGDWVGQDIPVPQAAVALLRPNVIISRKYTNFITGSTASVLLVHCSDARDLMGHYPPICYPNQGWAMEEATAHDWRVEGINTVLHGMEYRFRRPRHDASDETIRNFMLLPDGTTAADMDGVRRVASTDHHFYGAGQIQIIVDSGMPEDERDQVFRSLVQGHASVLAAILAGPHTNGHKG